MQNDHSRNHPSNLSRQVSRSSAQQDIPPLASTDADSYWLQSAGTWRERRLPGALLLVLFGSAPALLTTRDAAGRPERTAVADEVAWYVPQNMFFSAHWHGPRPLICLGLSAAGAMCDAARIFRMCDLVRMDWDLGELRRNHHRLDEGGGEAAMVIARQVGRILQDSATPWRTVGLSTQRLQATTDFIEENLAQKLSREQLARVDGQSLHHFARMFKLRTGLTLRDYITLRRCFRARELVSSGVRLADAAAAVGFFDQPEMCRKFNHVFGCPPSSFAPSDPA